MRLICICHARPVSKRMGVNVSVANKINSAQKPVERSINSIGLAVKLSATPSQIKRTNGIRHTENTKALIHVICFLVGLFFKKANMAITLSTLKVFT